MAVRGRSGSFLAKTAMTIEIGCIRKSLGGQVAIFADLKKPGGLPAVDGPVGSLFCRELFGSCFLGCGCEVAAFAADVAPAAVAEPEPACAVVVVI